MSLLMPSRPIVINPDLAYSIGLNEAIALQQVNYWLKETTSGLERDGVRWIYNTNEQWLEQFPFWSESTLKRTFTRLKQLGVLKVEQLNTTENTTDIKKPICPVAPQPDDIDPAIRVLSHFNEVTGSSYGKGGRNKTVLGYIRGRLSENYSAEDLMLVVDYLTAKWADDPKMDDYLRPSTLFGPENCVEYFDKAQKWQKRGRPACVKGRWQLGGSADPNFKANFQNVDYSVPANSGFRVSGGTQ